VRVSEVGRVRVSEVGRVREAALKEKLEKLMYDVLYHISFFTFYSRVRERGSHEL
jgi:hypothetical protein